MNPVARTDPLPVPGFDAMLGFLQSPAAHAAYAAADAPVQAIETHMSWVFLVGDHALKLKKPVRHPFLDFSTLAAREFYCREELRLNARLAPGVYIDVMALQWRGGQFALIPDPARPVDGRTVDWLVRMRRLPAVRMLDRAIAQALVGRREIDALVRVLGAFYRSVPAIDVAPVDWAARFQHDMALGRDLLLRPQFQLHDAATALDRYGRALARCRGALDERALRGRIVDGHGDLRPEHVCLIEPPVVIDCLEFNAQLRQVDPFDEIAFLGLECEMAGAAWIGPQLAAGCAKALGDAPPAALMHLYSAGRALLRARLAVAHLLEPQPRMAGKWQPLAKRYIARCLARLMALERGDDFSAATSRGNP